MPSIEENIKAWGNDKRWSQELNLGDKWSNSWGNVDMQWYASLLPRIHKYLINKRERLSVGTILEIAPGYGRWTQYLQALCKQLILVDLNQNCIEACEKRFSHLSHLEYHVNDGKSLSMTKDNSVDFIFSYDSLVHVEEDVISLYLKDISSKLTPEGVAFIHHSNLGNYLSQVDNEEISPHWRARSMTFEKFKLFVENNGLSCVSQELFNWGNESGVNTDCFSVIARTNSKWTSNYTLIESDFMTEAKYIYNLSEAYCVQ